VAVGDYALFDDEFQGIEDTVPITIYTKPSDTGKVKGSFVNLKDILTWNVIYYRSVSDSRDF
jgi:aminopeptidase N